MMDLKVYFRHYKTINKIGDIIKQAKMSNKLKTVFMMMIKFLLMIKNILIIKKVKVTIIVFIDKMIN